MEIGLRVGMPVLTMLAQKRRFSVSDTIVTPAKRLTNSQVTRHSVYHFYICSGEGVEDASTMQANFLIQHLGN